MNKNLVDAVTKVAESAGWQVSQENGKFEFQKCSPAGQDFHVSVSAGTVSELNSALTERYNDFDCSEEAYLWLDDSGHGKNGAPHDMKDVYEDMAACREMISELADTIESNQLGWDDEDTMDDDLEP